MPLCCTEYRSQWSLQPDFVLRELGFQASQRRGQPLASHPMGDRRSLPTDSGHLPSCAQRRPTSGRRRQSLIIEVLLMYEHQNPSPLKIQHLPRMGPCFSRFAPHASNFIGEGRELGHSQLARRSATTLLMQNTCVHISMGKR